MQASTASPTFPSKDMSTEAAGAIWGLAANDIKGSLEETQSKALAPTPYDSECPSPFSTKATG